MNILLIAENWPPRKGGIENYLTHIASLLPKGSVTVLAPSGSQNPEIQGSGIKQLITKRFFWPLIKPAWLPLFFFVRKLVRNEKIDVILCGKTLFEGLLAYHIKKSLGTPYIVCTYAMEMAVWAKENRKKLVQVLQNADRVTYINEKTKQLLLELGVQETQLVKVWPGISEHWFKEVSADTKAAVVKKYSLQSPYIVTGARLIERKGIDTVIQAFGMLADHFPNLQLAIFGDGPDKQKLQELAAQQKNSSGIHFLGHIPTSDLPALYAGAQLYALPPKELERNIEGFGIVYLEAAAQGLPTIGTLTGGVPEAVIHKETGLLVQPDNSKALHEALELLLKDEAFRKQLGEAGKRRAWNEFRWNKRILLIKGIFDAIMAEKILKKRAS